MIEYRKLTTEVEGTKFRELHNVLFKNTNASLAWFRWYFDKIGRLGNSYSRVYGAFDGEKLVGCWCVEPKVLQLPLSEKMIANGVTTNQMHVGRCFAVGIHPDYQRRGIFIELSKFAIQQEKELAEFEYVLGFPQVGKPVIAGHLKAGWESVQVIDMLSWKQTPALNPTTLSQVEIVRSFVHYASPRLSKDAIGFVESSEYRNLRWLKNPDNAYITLAKNDAAVVLKPYGAACHILDLYGHNYFDIAVVLNAAKTLAYRHRWKELTAWCAPNDVHRLEMIGSRFQPGTEFGLPVQVLAVRINAKTELRFNGEVQFRQGVEEVY